ncbi:hypothetical protein GXW78_22960 [Roseomonas terrae]|uniref:Polysaccharide chain length determinant N-terminal domain-containing protein n=1 Tax=Neoroseomonas terrae TaxID=424799 RepID=A0ABS5ENK4_9PROT|nr:hypothetical protein [Neoroseomonas terrae]MBR0652535.1 hypothetical protein [Neoroseomonas terrae]
MPLSLLLSGLWCRRWQLLSIMAVLWIGGATLILLTPRAHVAQSVVAPAETTSFAVSTLLSPSPFAPAGLLDTRPSGNFAVYLGALRSPEAATMLTRDTSIAEALTRRRMAGLGGALRALLGADRPADADDVLDWLTRNLAVTQSLASVTWTIEIAQQDPALALDMLRRLHGFAEAKVRADLAEQAGRRVAALERRIARENDVFLRNSLYELLAQQQRAGLVVAADESVAARVVSAPMVEARPSLPNRPLLMALLAVAVPVAVLLAAAALLLMRFNPVRAVVAAAAPPPARQRQEPAMMPAGLPDRPPPPIPPPRGIGEC